VRNETAVRETETVPKKTTPRVPGPDDWAAARIRHERELRGWSTAELARRVTESGVPLRQQQVWQIESGDPPRKLSVGEAAAIASIFGLTIGDLLTPPHELAMQDLMNLGRDFAAWRRDVGLLAARLRELDERAGQLESDEDLRLTASAVLKYSGYGKSVERAAAEFDEIAAVYASIGQAIRDHALVWSLVVSTMRELPSPEDAPAAKEGDDGDA
jgi:transcriptional regulator with XRE-family HTH domain